MRVAAGICFLLAIAVAITAGAAGATMIPDRYAPDSALAWRSVLTLWAGGAFAATVLFGLGQIVADVGRLADKVAPPPPPPPPPTGGLP